jgi:hypothetical protein
VQISNYWPRFLSCIVAVVVFLSTFLQLPSETSIYDCRFSKMTSETALIKGKSADVKIFPSLLKHQGQSHRIPVNIFVLFNRTNAKERFFLLFICKLSTNTHTNGSNFALPDKSISFLSLHGSAQAFWFAWYVSIKCLTIDLFSSVFPLG